MQLLGLYTPGSLRNILKTLKELHNAQLFLPIVLRLEREGFTPVSGHIRIFPAFYSVDHLVTFHQVLAQSFRKDQDNHMLDNVSELSIYMIDSSDMSSIYGLAKGMDVSFRISWLSLWFERRCEIVSFLLTVYDYNRT